MKTDKPFIDAMRHATHLVRTQGPAAATRFIQGLFRGRRDAPDVAPDIAPADESLVDPQIDRPLSPPPADSGRFLSKRFSSSAGARNYKLYVPASYGGSPAPLVVMLHGCTQDSDDFAIGTRANRRAEDKRCLVAYPEQLRRSNAHRCWNWFRPSDQQHGHGEPAIIAGITQQVIDEYRIDAQRVYVAGLSAGGAMAAIIGQAYPQLFAAIAIHSGVPVGAAANVPSAFAVMKSGPSHPTMQQRAIPTIVLHGDADPTVHPKNGARIVADAIRARSAGEPQQSLRTVVETSDATPENYAYRRTTHADESNTVLIEQWEIHGAGHAWSGGDAAGSHTDARGPDATRAMLDFFEQLRAREAHATDVTDVTDVTDLAAPT